MNPTEFIDICISELLQKISKEDKTIMLMGDFNIDLLKYDTNADSATFLDSMYINFLLPYISTTTPVTTRSKTVIDNIFSNNIEDSLISGNITTTITDHYAHFILKKDIKLQRTNQKLFRKNYFKNLNNAQFDFELKTLTGTQFLKLIKKMIYLLTNFF